MILTFFKLKNFYNLIILIFIINLFNLPDNAYKLMNSKYEERLNSTYGYCFPQGYGFIREIEQEYNLKNIKTLNFEDFAESDFFLNDPRKKELGGRLLSSLEKLHLIVKKLELKICEEEIYYKKAHSLGVPIKGLRYLKDQLFGLEANFEEFKAIDFKKGCYIGQENTARLKLRNKLRKKLLPLKTEANLKIGSVFKLNDREVGRVLIDKPFPFVLVNLYYINSKNLFKENFLINGKKATLIDSKNI